MAKRKAPVFEIPQLPQKITINCKKLDEKQLYFLSKALDPKTNIMFINGPAGSTKTYMAVYSALRLLGAHDELDLLYVIQCTSYTEGLPTSSPQDGPEGK